jgi:hypothetical protein
MSEQEISTLISLATLCVSVIAVIIVFYQLRAAKLSIEKDHKRRERQATLDYIYSNFPVINSHYWELKQQFGSDRVWSQETIDKIENTPKSKQALNELLDRIEILTIGVYRGVYSFDIVYDFAELQLLRMHDQLYPVILMWREKYNKNDLFESFDFIVQKMKRERSPEKVIDAI